MSPNEISSKFIAKFDVFTADENELKEKLDLLLKNNVNREKIIAVSFFRCSLACLQRSIDESKANGVKDIKAGITGLIQPSEIAFSNDNRKRKS